MLGIHLRPILRLLLGWFISFLTIGSIYSASSSSDLWQKSTDIDNKHWEAIDNHVKKSYGEVINGGSVTKAPRMVIRYNGKLISDNDNPNPTLDDSIGTIYKGSMQSFLQKYGKGNLKDPFNKNPKVKVTKQAMASMIAEAFNIKSLQENNNLIVSIGQLFKYTNNDGTKNSLKDLKELNADDIFHLYKNDNEKIDNMINIPKDNNTIGIIESIVACIEIRTPEYDKEVKERKRKEEFNRKLRFIFIGLALVGSFFLVTWFFILYKESKSKNKKKSKQVGDQVQATTVPSEATISKQKKNTPRGKSKREF